MKKAKEQDCIIIILALFSTYCKCSFQTSKRRGKKPNIRLASQRNIAWDKPTSFKLHFPRSSLEEVENLQPSSTFFFPDFSTVTANSIFNFHGGRKPHSDSIQHYENWQTRLHLSTSNFCAFRMPRPPLSHLNIKQLACPPAPPPPPAAAAVSSTTSPTLQAVGGDSSSRPPPPPGKHKTGPAESGREKYEKIFQFKTNSLT